jgi:hypothetical protein
MFFTGVHKSRKGHHQTETLFLKDYKQTNSFIGDSAEEIKG